MFVNEKPNQYISVIMAFFFTQFNKVMLTRNVWVSVFTAQVTFGILFIYLCQFGVYARICASRVKIQLTRTLLR